MAGQGDHLLTGDRILLSHSDLGEPKKRKWEAIKRLWSQVMGDVGTVGVGKMAFGSGQQYVAFPVLGMESVALSHSCSTLPPPFSPHLSALFVVILPLTQNLFLYLIPLHFYQV